MKQVVTINGETLDISLVKRFNNKGYYKIGDNRIPNSGDCYKIKDKYYRFEVGNIVWDNHLNEYNLITDAKLVEGVIGIELDGSLKLGWFTRTPLNVQLVLKDSVHAVLNSKILIGIPEYYEDLTTGIFLESENVPMKMINLKAKITNEYKRNFPYSLDLERIPRTMNIRNNFFKIEHQVKDPILRLLKNYTYGFEFETIEGKIPSNLADILGLVPLRDGSITGLEYASIPYTGEELVSNLKRNVEALNRYTSSDLTCSIHIHIGGMPRTKEFLLSYARVLSIVQDDLFKMFPFYKKNSYGVKQKEYTKPYRFDKLNMCLDRVIDNTNIDRNFDELFTSLSGGVSFTEYNSNLENVKGHPRDPRNQQKWNIDARYHFVNLIPIVFTNHKTIEFRLHNTTKDYKNLYMFTLLNLCILEYAKVKQNEILKFPEKLTNLDMHSIVNRICDLYDTSYSRYIRNYIEASVYNQIEQIRDGALFTDTDYSTAASEKTLYIVDLNVPKKEPQNVVINPFLGSSPETLTKQKNKYEQLLNEVKELNDGDWII